LAQFTQAPPVSTEVNPQPFAHGEHALPVRHFGAAVFGHPVGLPQGQIPEPFCMFDAPREEHVAMGTAPARVDGVPTLAQQSCVSWFDDAVVEEISKIQLRSSQSGLWFAWEHDDWQIFQ
jgi:hypothetical protein